MKKNKKATADLFDFLFMVIVAVFVLFFVGMALSGGQREKEKATLTALEDLKLDKTVLILLKTPVSEVWDSYEEDFGINKDTTFADLFVLMKNDLAGPFSDAGGNFYKTSLGREWNFVPLLYTVTEGKIARVQVYDNEEEILRYRWKGKGFRHTSEINLPRDKKVVISLSENQ